MMDVPPEAHNPNPAVPADKLIQAYIIIRDQRSALKQDYEDADSLLKGKLNRIEQALAVHMASVGSDNLSAHGIGTAYREIEKKYSSSDWTTLWGFIQESGRFDLLQKRVGEGACEAYFKETGELPPGVSLHQEWVVKVRRK